MQRANQKVLKRKGAEWITIVLLVFILLGRGRTYNTAKGSDFPMMSLFVNSFACTSFTSNVPTGFNSRSLNTKRKKIIKLDIKKITIQRSWFEYNEHAILLEVCHQPHWIGAPCQLFCSTNLQVSKNFLYWLS